LVIPTYKERDNIAPLVERIHRALSPYDYEVVFIDDNSRDGTAEAVTALASRYPVRVVVRTDKRGLASAVVDGIGYARGDIIGVMDADLQHPPEVLPDLIKAIHDGADVAVGSRYVKGGGCQGWSLTRRLISRGATLIVHVLLPVTRQVKDPMAGFFMFRHSVVTGVTLNPLGYKILLEILMEGNIGQVKECPFIFQTRSRGESKLSSKTQREYLKHVFSLMQRKGEIRRLVTFILVGGSGVVVNLGIFAALTKLTSSPYLLAAGVAIELSIISNFILNDRFTFQDRRRRGSGQFWQRLGKFNLIALPGVGINIGVPLLILDHSGVYYYLAYLCGIVIATIWNYFMSTLWTWK
jgi:dolichol-phosphate mannosyltransferase